MPDRKPRIIPQHTWAGVAHNLLNLFPHRRFVAMDGAIFAGRFFVAIRASVEALQRIVPQCITFRTRLFMTVTTAVNNDHGWDGLFLYINMSGSKFIEHFIGFKYQILNSKRKVLSPKFKDFIQSRNPSVSPSLSLPVSLSPLLPIFLLYSTLRFRLLSLNQRIKPVIKTMRINNPMMGMNQGWYLPKMT